MDIHEADLLSTEVHEGSFGTHSNVHVMTKNMLRVGYYWLIMEFDCCKFVKKCQKCQIYANKIHVPPTLLNVISSPWPFSMWGIDMIGMIEPKALNEHRFILVAIDYFTKWVEAASYANVTKQVVVRFIKKQIICCYGVPSKILTWHTIPAYNLTLAKPYNNLLGYICIRCRFNPLCEVINNHQNKTMSVRSFRLNHANHINSLHGGGPWRGNDI